MYVVFFIESSRKNIKKLNLNKKRDVYYDVSSEIFVHPQGFEPWTH